MFPSTPNNMRKQPEVQMCWRGRGSKKAFESVEGDGELSRTSRGDVLCPVITSSGRCEEDADWRLAFCHYTQNPSHCTETRPICLLYADLLLLSRTSYPMSGPDEES